ncbi:MAG: HpcH/HpaI aldolase/citrate lyase family protein [Lachnospiraceae bacterium]|nr:HpcH/HpaI aldolase/citrate lyase family protein [Lachnospiraceae bacterium]MDE7274895.1 HpcH/HpaI aldolase/citrate lyase family protein [Lachnospiraceae bacterium]
MNNSLLYYSVGALLYCPANKKTIADSIINNRFGTKYSLALCLEDTIRDDCVAEAEHILTDTLYCLDRQSQQRAFYMPKIFVRVRNARQIGRLHKTFGESARLVTGFILPKFSLENADGYIQEIVKANETSKNCVYTMPIFESPSIIDLRSRAEILYALKDKLDQIEDRVLNIRVGGNDLCHVFGFRRHDDESIHQIRPVADIFSDIITVYGMDYVVSGPVWEYYRSHNWEKGLYHEIADDKLCGFVGKTVIYPGQIAVVNEAYKVSENDYRDASAICSWDKTSHSLVSGSASKERMNEYKTHSNWALRTLLMAEYFGVKNY